MVKWVVYVGAGLAALVIIITLVGYLLPMAHVASRTATLSRPPVDVFLAITDIRKYPDWRPGVGSVEVLSSTPLMRWTEHGSNGDITFEFVETTAHSRAIARIADPSLPFGGRWTYELVPAGAGTRLTITEHGEVYNPIFRFMSRFVFGHTSTIEQFLSALQRRLA